MLPDAGIPGPRMWSHKAQAESNNTGITGLQRSCGGVSLNTQTDTKARDACVMPSMLCPCSPWPGLGQALLGVAFSPGQPRPFVARNSGPFCSPSARARPVVVGAPRQGHVCWEGKESMSHRNHSALNRPNTTSWSSQ